MKYTTRKKLYIEDVDRSPAEYCISGEYKEVDQNKITFDEWINKSLSFDPEVDWTYWVLKQDFPVETKEKYKKANKDFKKSKYIVTNRRIVHIFNSKPMFHKSGFHNSPKHYIDVFKAIYKPTWVKFLDKGYGRHDAYVLKNRKNKVKSFVSTLDNKKYLKIQTAYIEESISAILDIDELYSNNIMLFENDLVLNESNIANLQEAYTIIKKMLFTYNPEETYLNINREINEGILLNEEQISIVVNNLDFINEELGYYYLLDGDTLELSSK